MWIQQATVQSETQWVGKWGHATARVSAGRIRHRAKVLCPQSFAEHLQNISMLCPEMDRIICKAQDFLFKKCLQVLYGDVYSRNNGNMNFIHINSVLFFVKIRSNSTNVRSHLSMLVRASVSACRLQKRKHGVDGNRIKIMCKLWIDWIVLIIGWNRTDNLRSVQLSKHVGELLALVWCLNVYTFPPFSSCCSTSRYTEDSWSSPDHSVDHSWSVEESVPSHPGSATACQTHPEYFRRVWTRCEQTIS